MEHEIHNIAEANRADHRPERRRILAGKLLLNFVSGLRNGEAGSPLRSLMENPHFWIRLDLANGHHIGPGKIALLEAIRAKGSIRAAAHHLGMSYRRAWLMVENINDAL